MTANKSIIQALENLGEELMLLSDGKANPDLQVDFDNLINRAESINPWFTHRFITLAFAAIGDSLKRESLISWLTPYQDQLENRSAPQQIGVVMAGNIPLVGFHDFLCVMISGNHFLGKLSSDDSLLLPYVADRLIVHCPELEGAIRFTEERLTDFKAVIATGSNNTARYFEYYFGKYPHIIRKNRNGVAILSGGETSEDLMKLGKDVFSYFGLGCRNVSKLYVPEGYDFTPMMDAFSAFGYLAESNKYKNNFDYYRSIFLVNSVKHFENGVILITESEEIASPPSVLYYETYDSMDVLSKKLSQKKEGIQCIVGHGPEPNVNFGDAQKPHLWDYADGIDTLEFLLNLRP